MLLNFKSAFMKPKNHFSLTYRSKVCGQDFFLKQYIILFNKDEIDSTVKSDREYIYNDISIKFQINTVLLNVLFIKESWK